MRCLIQLQYAQVWHDKVPQPPHTSHCMGPFSFGTHNWDSCRQVLQHLANHGLARPVDHIPSETQPKGYGLPDEPVLAISDDVADRICLSQLYGMSDALTNYVVSRTRTSSPIVLKYLPYGGLSEVCQNVKFE